MVPIKAPLALILAFIAPALAGAQNAADGERAAKLAAQADEMWKSAWGLFFSPKTNLFYDFASSYKTDGSQFAHLPTREEAEACFPNTSGTGTGMEDCMIIAGIMLDAVVNRFDVEKDASLKAYADKILEGVYLCSQVGNSQGYIARGVGVDDAKPYYIGSSRDQYTHALYGIWRYYNSPMCDAAAKAKIKKICGDVGERLLKYMTPENGYDYRLADGRPCPAGLSKMWNVLPHEAARLPMFYGIIWDITRDARYRAEYEKFIKPAVEQSKSFAKTNPGWADMQMMMSLCALEKIETDPALRAQISAIKKSLAKSDNKRVVANAARFFGIARKFDMSMLPPDWRRPVEWRFRKGVPHYATPRWGDYHKVWYAGRGVGEFAWSAIMGGAEPKTLEALEDVMLATNYAKTSSCSVMFHLACYWAERRFCAGAQK